MANLVENYGLDFLTEDENIYMGFIGHVVQEGKAVNSYSGNPYLYEPMGDVEFWVSTERNEEGQFSVAGIDTHCGGVCVWDVVHSGIDITPKDRAGHERIIIVNRKDDHGGLLPMDIITADVLPSYLEHDRLQVQVVAQPLDINYYADEDEYAEAQPEDENGKKWLIANGSLVASQFLYNHAPERYEQGKDYESDSYILFNATVSRLYHGTFEMGDHKENTFIRCIAETEYGELEFDHTLDQVPEELRKNIKVGSIISGVCILSGDVAIGEYEKGIVKDFDHNLRLLRYTFVKGEAERLRSVLSEDAVYETETSGKQYCGPAAIIERMNYVHENSSSKYYAHLATVSEADNLEYPPGTRCIVLASGQKNNYESIAFISVNNEGAITKIKISTDSKYHFNVDVPEKISTPLDDIKIPESVFEPIILRARLHGIINDDLDDAILKNNPDYYSLEKNAQRMLDALQEDPQPDVEEAFSNIFGYLFAKAMEMSINEEKENPDHKTRLTASYIPGEAFEGEISSTLSEEQHARLEKALKLGKQFYNDFKYYVQVKDIKEDAFVRVFKEAAVIVQRLGQLGAKKFME